MAKMSKLIKMGFQPHADRILVCDPETSMEYYIDLQTTRKNDGMFLVKPIAEDEHYFWYICPFCQQVHIESKRNLVTVNRVLWSGCEYRNRFPQYFCIVHDSEKLALQEAEDGTLEAEWNFMQAFEK